MRNVFTVALLAIGLAWATTGCESKSETTASAPAVVTRQELNQAKMSEAVVPQAVQTAFAQDHHGASIDTIRMETTSTGRNFYEITYFQNGKPGIARYFPTGTSLPALQ